MVKFGAITQELVSIGGALVVLSICQAKNVLEAFMFFNIFCFSVATAMTAVMVTALYSVRIFKNNYIYYVVLQILGCECVHSQTTTWL